MFKNKVSGFEVPIGDFSKGKEFYGSVFDWKIEDMGGDGFFAYTTKSGIDMIPTEPGGINGGFYKRKSPQDRPNLIVNTDSIDDTLAKIVKAGGKVLTPKHEMGEWGSMADFVDPEGNEMSLWEYKK